MNNNKKTIDWDERRFMATISVLAGKAAAGRVMGSVAVHESLRCADILIEKLREDEERDTNETNV
ncbi:MAG: hypothetical protein SOX13_07615 [Sodaliphilus sp.]|nr:hypothetical protein [Sodaliphilus sp.]